LTVLFVIAYINAHGGALGAARLKGKIMRIPKGLSEHPAVRMVETSDTNGSDSKYIVHVKDGWYFTRGHAEGCSGSIGVDTVAEFLYAKPEKRE